MPVHNVARWLVATMASERRNRNSDVLNVSALCRPHAVQTGPTGMNGMHDDTTGPMRTTAQHPALPLQCDVSACVNCKILVLSRLREKPKQFSSRLFIQPKISERYRSPRCKHGLSSVLSYQRFFEALTERWAYLWDKLGTSLSVDLEPGWASSSDLTITPVQALWMVMSEDAQSFFVLALAMVEQLRLPLSRLSEGLLLLAEAAQLDLPERLPEKMTVWVPDPPPTETTTRE